MFICRAAGTARIYRKIKWTYVKKYELKEDSKESIPRKIGEIANNGTYRKKWEQERKKEKCNRI